MKTVSISGNVVALSPTSQGILKLADIYAACRISHTVNALYSEGTR